MMPKCWLEGVRNAVLGLSDELHLHLAIGSLVQIYK